MPPARRRQWSAPPSAAGDQRERHLPIRNVFIRIMILTAPGNPDRRFPVGFSITLMVR